MVTTTAPTTPPLTAEPVTSVRNHLEGLTGLRIFAALAVYFSHLARPKGAPVWLDTMLASGYYGVTFFFVLSGFVLTINYWDRLGSLHQLWAFAAARFARVYPVYLLVLSWPAMHLLALHELPKKRLLEHALALQAWDPDVNWSFAFVGPAWSIGVEFFLYACLPLLVFALRPLDRRWWHLVLGMLAVTAAMLALAAWFVHSGRGGLSPVSPASAHRWLYRMPLTRLGDFALGVMAARLYVHLRHRHRIGRAGWLIVPALGITLFVATRESLLSSAWSWDVAYAVPATLLLLGLALSPLNPLSRFLALRPIIFLGEISYAFYLVHTLVLSTLGAGGWAKAMSVTEVLIEVQNLGVALGLAAGIHVLVERPAREWLRRVLIRAPRKHPV